MNPSNSSQVPDLTSARDVYTIGLVCELSEAQTAAIMMLDERHDYIPKESYDPNTYTLGSIAEHNVVIACIPRLQQGLKTLADITLWMTSTFPSVRLCLLVGTGYGLPSRVRLGDVVVGMPDDRCSGVVKWQVPGDWGFGEVDKMVYPPHLLLSAVTKLRSIREIDGSKMREYLNRFREREGLASKYLVSEKLEDLFIENGNDKTRKNKGTNYVVAPVSNIREPEIHYGLIAYTTHKMPDNKTRDNLDSKLCSHRLLCIDTEGSELITRFPCLVIRGIRDYADERHNASKGWKEPAAAVAAAFAKEVVVALSKAEVALLPTIFDMRASVF